MSHIRFFLEDDDHKTVDFNWETINFSCQLIKKSKRLNLIIVRPKKKTEIFLLSITENCETAIKKTRTKPRETLEFKLTKPRETSSCKPPISIERS